MAKLSDYPARPGGVNTDAAKAHGWGDGWPHCQRSKIVAVERGGVTFYVRRELSALIAELLQATETRYRYDIKNGQSWGYACRPIEGTQTPSNHSWGLAVDINSLANPRKEHFTTNLPPDVVAMWWTCGFYWGGWYTDRPDTMHFEYVHRPADVAGHLALAKQFRGAVGGFVPPSLKLTQPRTRGDRVKFLQQRLNAKGAHPALAVDGVFGPKTDAALRAFQHKAHLTVDGVYGPKTHAALAA
jgi:hypothetical protein